MKGYHHVNQRQRYLIEDLLSLGKSKAFIAREIGVHRSTICREVRRNKNSQGGYKAKGAHSATLGRRPGIWEYQRKIKGLLEEVIAEKLNDRWSPAQISARLKDEGRWSISHQSIYTWIYRIWPDAKAALRIRRKRRRRKGRKDRPFPGKDKRKNIELRPLEVEERTELGHWERDLLEGRRGNSALLVMVERKSRYTLLAKTESKFSNHIAELTRNSLGNHICWTMTNDNGVEFGHPPMQEAIIGKPVFYTDPYTSWQRGTVENTNGLLRQYVPKGCEINELPDDYIRYVQDQLNSRPRRGLNFRTPKEEFFGLKEKLIDSDYAIRKRMYERIDREISQSFANLNVALNP